MPISVSCSNCTAKFKAPDQAAGRKTKCPKCGGEIQITAAAPTAPAALTAAPMPAATASPVAPKPPVAKPAARLPMAQAVPSLASDLPVAQPLASSLPQSAPVPVAQSAARRSVTLVLFALLGFLSLILLASYFVPPESEDGKNNAAKARGKNTESEAMFESVVQQVHAEYTIPNNEKKPPRPPATLTPRENKLLYVINGDRLGMTTEEFRTKYRHKLQGDSRPSPMMSDHRHQEARRSNPLETLAEAPWHVDANMVHARITWPFEDSANSSYTPSFGGVRATDHRFMFVDEQLWRMQFMFPSSEFAKLRQAVIAQLGPPNAKPSSLGITLRGSYPGAILSWSNELAEVDLVERTLEGETSFLLIRHLALEELDESRRPPKNGAAAPKQPAVPRTPAVPRPSSPLVRRSAPNELNGDRLGMSLTEFKVKHHHRGDLDGKEYPRTSDAYPISVRERAKLTEFSEPVWHARAGIVNAILASPDELASNSPHVPSIGSTLTTKHVYRFLDRKLSSIEYLVPRANYNDVADTLQQIYGPPSIDRENLKELYTKKHGGEFLYWSNGNTEMFLVERYDDGEKTLFFFADVPMQKETMNRRTVILGK